MKSKSPVILIIRDGWGYRLAKKNNIIAQANTPWNDLFIKQYPNGLLNASGEAVGLPKGYQGNSEVGHMTIGSGRIIEQSLVRINKSIKSGEFFSKQVFLNTIRGCKKNKKTLHLLGLLQEEGVHSHINHLFALLDLCQKENFKNILLHIITDGRDAAPTDSLRLVSKLERKLKKLGFGEIATISGRYYSLDRNEYYDRTKLSFDCLSSAQGQTNTKTFSNTKEYIKNCHKRGETDEFIKPVRHADYKGLRNNDALIFFNFRTDRPRQLTKALIEKKFPYFPRKELKKINFVAMTKYYSPFPGKVAFEEPVLVNLLGEVIANNNYRQLRISETEKYAHVTFFFNGQKEKPLKAEDRILIPSPRLKTYDLKPEMSALKIAARLKKEIKSQKYDFIVVNLVNCDMVGHTANLKAIKKAVEAVDVAMGEIVTAGLKNNYTSIVFADHGNAEDKSHDYETSHTNNPVPVIVVSNNEEINKQEIRKGAGLKDIAATVLKIMEIETPKEMSNKSIHTSNIDKLE